MTFPNALKGVRNMHRAAVLTIVSSVLLAASAAAVALFLAFKQDVDTNVGGGVLAIVAMLAGLGSIVVLVVATIIEIVGYEQAGKDERLFKLAVFCSIVGFILSVSSTLLLNETGPRGWLSTGLAMGKDVMTLLEFWFTITALMRLAEKYGREDMLARGRTILKVLLSINILSLFILLANEFFMSNLFNSYFALVCTVATLALTVVEFVLFIRYLSTAVRMLQD